MRNFLNSFPCRVLRGGFKLGSLFMGFVAAQRLEPTSTAFSLLCCSLSGLWYSLCQIEVKSFSVAVLVSLALQVRSNSQFRVTQAQGFCAGRRALTRTSKGQSNASRSPTPVVGVSGYVFDAKFPKQFSVPPPSWWLQIQLTVYGFRGGSEIRTHFYSIFAFVPFALWPVVFALQDRGKIIFSCSSQIFLSQSPHK